MIRSNHLYFFTFTILLGGCAGSLPSRPSAVKPPPKSAIHEINLTRPSLRSRAVLQALSALGTRYRYGGTSYAKGFDCSGLVAHVFLEAYGIRLPHSALAQSKLGTPVSLADLRPGDLVFYDTDHRPFSHVGIYIGNNQFVHAPQTGERVQVADMNRRYWRRRYDGARRIEPLQAGGR